MIDKRPIPELFVEILWSTDLVLKKILERVGYLNLTYALLEPWFDIDTYDDLVQLLERTMKRSDEDGGPGWRSLKYIRKTLYS